MKFNIKNPLFILVAGLILVGASVIGYTKADEIVRSSDQEVQFETAKFQVDLMEEQDGKYVTVAGSHKAPGALSFTDPALASGELQMEHDYDEKVKIVNNSSGDFPQYVRVVVIKHWIDENGETNLSEDPANIQLKINTDAGWMVVDEEPDDEETIYYYPVPLQKDEEKPLIEAIRFKAGTITEDDVTTTVNKIDGDEYVTISTYKDKTFEVKVRVDAVQNRHAEDALLGAWGVDVELATDGTINKIDGTPLKAVVNP